MYLIELMITFYSERNDIMFKPNIYTICLIALMVIRGSYMVWEINMGVCSRLEFDNIMLISCLGYDFYIHGAYEFLCNSIANL